MPNSAVFDVSAKRAESAHVEHALQQMEAMGTGGLLPCRQHGATGKLLGAATAHTHQMVVAGVGIAGELKAAAAIGQFQLLQEAQGTQQPQAPVHSGQGDPPITEPQLAVHLLGAQVQPLPHPLEQLEHLAALGGQPLTALVQTAAQADGGSGGA